MDQPDKYQNFLETKLNLGAAHGFAPLWMPEFLYDFQRSLVEWALLKGRGAIFADCGLGKGQPEGAMILTPDGFKKNTELNPGELIVASDGEAYPLLAKYERGMQPIFRVHFTDGASFVVDSDHLHIVRTNNDRQRRKPWRVLSTKELLSVRLRYGMNRNSRNYDIPVVAPIHGDRKSHWIHPYIMGVILGDGCITKGCTITLADQQILETVRAFLPKGWTLRKKITSKYDYHLSKDGENDRDFIKELRRLHVYGKKSGTKFIPSEYLWDSPDNRLWLLRGLMDTDGYIKESSQFYSTSKLLADDVLTLIRSLGGVPTRTIKQTSCIHNGTRRIGAPCHVLTFSLKTFNPFHLARKAVKWNPNPRDNGRWIDKIESCGRAKTICLSVGSPDQSYVTENFIVTHNTPMQLVWAENIVKKTNKPVLILTPLAVSLQTKREAEKFDIECFRTQDGTIHKGINVTNYERLHQFNPADFAAVVCDESSILKSYDGKTRHAVTEFMKKIPYRLLCTATAAPNDYIELGTSSEAIGELGAMDMMNRFFKNTQNDSKVGRHRGVTVKWRLKGHADGPFWQWVSSWARALRKPSDLGFDDTDFVLPPLKENLHIVTTESPPDGLLFTMPAVGLFEQRQERKRTIKERCRKVCDLVGNTGEPALVWCHLNVEGDMLEKIIPGAVQIKGADSDESKERKFLAFISGEARVLVTKPKIGAWGLNLQHCNHITFFPSHSYEQYYQGVRRCWRFGQKRPVTVDVVSTEGEKDVMSNLQRKADAADQMFSALTAEMHNATTIKRGVSFTEKAEVPTWL